MGLLINRLVNCLFGSVVGWFEDALIEGSV